MDLSVGLIALVAILVIVLLFLFAAVKVAREYERGVIFRLGRLLPIPRARVSSSSSRWSTGW